MHSVLPLQFVYHCSNTTTTTTITTNATIVRSYNKSVLHATCCTEVLNTPHVLVSTCEHTADSSPMPGVPPSQNDQGLEVAIVPQALHVRFSTSASKATIALLI